MLPAPTCTCHSLNYLLYTPTYCFLSYLPPLLSLLLLPAHTPAPSLLLFFHLPSNAYCSNAPRRTHSVILVGAGGEVSYTESTLTDFDSFSWDSKTIKFTLEDGPMDVNKL